MLGSVGNREAKILIVDDEPELARSLFKSLQNRANKNDLDKIVFHLAHNREDAISIVNKEHPEVAILDLTIDINEGPDSGLSLLDTIHQIDPSIRIIVLTSHSASKYGVNALSRGALSYQEKPGNPDLLLSLIKDSINICNLKRSHQKMALELKSRSKSLSLLGVTKSPVMVKTLEDIDFAASHTQPVLLTGETGTGKGFVARIIHASSNKSKKPFVRYQPNFANPDLVASELFGHKRGAFTGANEDRKGLIQEADGGTLFIDEIDALPKEVQVLLLEVLQEKTFRKVGSSREEKSDFRLISALNKDPERMLKEEVLRLDFFHRIAHFRIQLPALRDRREDIPVLASQFAQNISEREDLEIIRIEEPAIHKLSLHHWSGNIRELQAVVEGAAFRASYRQSRTIESIDIFLQGSQAITSGTESTATLTEGNFRNQVRLFEEGLVKKALDAHSGNQAQAAKALQMDRTVLRRILERLEKQS